MDNLQYSNVRVCERDLELSFKPYYKWITFNIPGYMFLLKVYYQVLNLIING